MEPQLTHVFTLRAHLALDSVHLGPHPSGSQRRIRALDGGTFCGVSDTRGEGMDATLVPGGSDWVLFDPATNVAQLDVRTQGKLSDGSGISVQYTGYLVMDEKAQQFMARGSDARSTEFGDHHWWTRPVFQTSAPQFKWMESTIFVGRGRCCLEDGQQILEYQIFEVGV